MVKISVYIDTGNVYSYEVDEEHKAREHAEAIVRTGYRSVQYEEADTLTWWPPHRIVKVVIKLDEESTTKYFDDVSST